MLMIYLALFGLERVMQKVIWGNIHAGLYENARLMLSQIPDASLNFILWLPILAWHGQRRFKAGLYLATIFLLFIFGAAGWDYAYANHYEISIYSGGVFLALLLVSVLDFLAMRPGNKSSG